MDIGITRMNAARPYRRPSQQASPHFGLLRLFGIGGWQDTERPFFQLSPQETEKVRAALTSSKRDGLQVVYPSTQGHNCGLWFNWQFYTLSGEIDIHHVDDETPQSLRIRVSNRTLSPEDPRQVYTLSRRTIGSDHTRKIYIHNQPDLTGNEPRFYAGPLRKEDREELTRLLDTYVK